MSNQHAQTKIVLCFIEGEPALYNKEIKEYFSISLLYNEILEKVKNHIKTSNYNVRPRMIKIWGILASFIPNCDAFCNYFSINSSKPNMNSFENRFSRDINSYLNQLYPVKQRDLKIELKRKYDKEIRMKKDAYYSDYAQKAYRKKKLKQKLGKRLY